ncbi:hypothetical protein HY546_00990 [archaeon]|nr:hypothetical protein [archaeon]
MPSIAEQVKKLPKQDIVLVITSASKYHAVNLSIVKYYLNTLHKRCIFVSMNRPAASLERLLREKKVKTNNIFFIDSVTRMAEPHGMTRAGNTIFLTSPQNLTDMGIAISEVAKSISKKERFLFFDSLSTLALYNASESVSRFAHFLTATLRKLNISAVFLILEKETDPKIVDGISQFCDSVVEIN